MLHGRDVDLARLVALIDDARGGTAGSVVVHGEPGVGKSALLAEVLSTMSDVRVLRTQGLESESPLAFAALHRLLRPALHLVERLPAPQARALGVAFGQQVGTVEPFLVAVATLSMLTEAAEEQPVACVVDDAQWLDSASTDALLFATRRLDADRVAMMFAARDTDDRTFAPTGCRPCGWPGWAPPRCGRCLRRTLRSWSRPRSAIGSSPRQAGTRSRSLNSRPGSVTRSWLGQFRCPRS